MEPMNNEKQTDWWGDLDDDAKASIERGLTQSIDNELVDHEDVMRECIDEE